MSELTNYIKLVLQNNTHYILNNLFLYFDQRYVYLSNYVDGDIHFNLNN
jgi:hypothetical protein